MLMMALLLAIGTLLSSIVVATFRDDSSRFSLHFSLKTFVPTLLFRHSFSLLFCFLSFQPVKKDEVRLGKQLNCAM